MANIFYCCSLSDICYVRTRFSLLLCYHVQCVSFCCCCCFVLDLRALLQYVSYITVSSYPNRVPGWGVITSTHQFFACMVMGTFLQKNLEMEDMVATTNVIRGALKRDLRIGILNFQQLWLKMHDFREIGIVTKQKYWFHTPNPRSNDRGRWGWSGEYFV